MENILINVFVNDLDDGNDYALNEFKSFRSALGCQVSSFSPDVAS